MININLIRGIIIIYFIVLINYCYCQNVITDSTNMDSSLDCNRRAYSHRVTQTDSEGRICWDTITVVSCWGRCDSNEVNIYWLIIDFLSLSFKFIFQLSFFVYDRFRIGDFHINVLIIRFASMAKENLKRLFYQIVIMMLNQVRKSTNLWKQFLANVLYVNHPKPIVRVFVIREMVKFSDFKGIELKLLSLLFNFELFSKFQ